MLYIYIYIYIYIYRCFPLHLLFIFVTGPSLHCLEGDSLECIIRLLSATHHDLFFDLHPSMPDVVHGPLLLLIREREKKIETMKHQKHICSMHRQTEGKHNGFIANVINLS